jgi:chaperonin GroES
MVERVIPKGASIFVIPDELVNKTASGLILTDWSAKRPTSGTVLALGPKATGFKKGDRVLFGEYAGLSLKIDDRDIFIMQPEDIIALLLPDDAK